MNQKSGQEIVEQLMEEGSHTQLRDELREAREYAINNSENYDQLLFAIERLGCRFYGEVKSLKKYFGKINSVAGLSPLAKNIPRQWEGLHTTFTELYDIFCICRNDAVHQGAFARHLTEKAIQISIILEDALMGLSQNICDFMVSNPVCAELWQPISFIRQQMLANSFSYLPVFCNPDDSENFDWHVVSDLNIARYLRTSTHKNGQKIDREKLLGMTLENAIKNHKLEINKVESFSNKEKTSVNEILKEDNHLPILIYFGNDKRSLIGILTMFDLL